MRAATWTSGACNDVGVSLYEAAIIIQARRSVAVTIALQQFHNSTFVFYLTHHH
jgi:hypothetical protein